MGVPSAGAGVAIPGVILRFLEHASIAYAATRDRSLAPHFHWVCGWMSEPDPHYLALFVAEPFSERLRQNVVEVPRLALTVEHIGPHETYQFKGGFAGTRSMGAAERAALEGCRARFVRDVQEIDTRHKFSTETLERYLGEPSLVALLEVHEIFLQTPGPGAGRRLVPPETR